MPENGFCKALPFRQSQLRETMKRIDTGNEAQQIKYEDDTWASGGNGLSTMSQASSPPSPAFAPKAANIIIFKVTFRADWYGVACMSFYRP